MKLIMFLAVHVAMEVDTDAPTLEGMPVDAALRLADPIEAQIKALPGVRTTAAMPIHFTTPEKFNELMEQAQQAVDSVVESIKQDTPEQNAPATTTLQ